MVCNGPWRVFIVFLLVLTGVLYPLFVFVVSFRPFFLPSFSTLARIRSVRALLDNARNLPHCTFDAGVFSFPKFAVV